MISVLIAIPYARVCPLAENTLNELHIHSLSVRSTPAHKQTPTNCSFEYCEDVKTPVLFLRVSSLTSLTWKARSLCVCLFILFIYLYLTQMCNFFNK